MSQIVIYLVDDDEVDRKMILKSLAPLDPQIDVATTGKELLANVKNKEYDLLLLDYKLPDCTGFELAQQVRSLGVHTTMILITGFGSDELEGQSKEAGFDGYAEKSQVTPLAIMTVFLRAVHEFQGEVKRQADRAIQKLDNIQELIKARINFHDEENQKITGN